MSPSTSWFSTSTSKLVVRSLLSCIFCSPLFSMFAFLLHFLILLFYLQFLMSFLHHVWFHSKHYELDVFQLYLSCLHLHMLYQTQNFVLTYLRMWWVCLPLHSTPLPLNQLFMLILENSFKWFLFEFFWSHRMSMVNDILDEFTVNLFHPVFFTERILSFIFTFIHKMLYVAS